MLERTEPRFKTVLVATDLSPLASRVVRRAVLLPLAEEATLRVLHVLPEGMPEKLQRVAKKTSQERLERLLREAAEVAKSAGTSGLRITSAVAVGQPYVEIIRCSRKLGAELIVLGRQSRKRLREQLMGSTPKRVIRKGDTPVLVVALEPTHPYRRPIVAVDLSDTSRRVVELALGLLGPEEMKTIVLVHAYQVPFAGWLSEGELVPEFRHTATTQLQELRASLGSDAVDWRGRVRKGDPRVVILAEANRRRAELIVLGTHGRSGVSHALLGSVAEWVTNEASCDVAITRPTRYSFELP
jgi:nucleotide-binding universal stress UspA family protein